MELNRGETAALMRGAMAEPGEGAPLLWTKDDNQLVVDAASAEVDTDEGLVVVSLPVRCEQTGDTVVQLGFAVGSATQPAGMVAASGDPRGPKAVVDVWGEELTALAWHAMLRVSAALARLAGRDLDGHGLIPAAIRADAGITVGTVARHDTIGGMDV